LTFEQGGNREAVFFVDRIDRYDVSPNGANEVCNSVTKRLTYAKQ
jgi:hypothetical protein